MRRLIDQLMRRVRSPGLQGQILRFAVVGGLGFVVDAAVLQGSVHLGASPAVGRVFSIAAAVTFTWILNRSLTFAAAAAPSWREYAHYVADSLAGMVVNYAVYSVAVFLHAPLMVALALGTIVGSVFNFLRYRRLLSGRDPVEEVPPSP
jgi:putative flippase GtrA